MIVGVVGPPIGGLVSQKHGYRAMFIVAGVFYGIATIIRVVMARGSGSKTVETGRHGFNLVGLKQSLGQMASLVLAGGAITWIFISDGVFDVAMSISGRLEPLYHSSIIGLTNVEISSFASIFHGTMMVLLPLGGWFADKAGERAGIVVGHLFFAAGALVFLFGNMYPLCCSIDTVWNWRVIDESFL